MNSFMGIVRGCQDIIGTLIFGGVFDRHPDLKVVCVEADAGWVAHWMCRADHAMDRHRTWLTAASLQRRPSEYFRENVYVTFQDDWVAFQTTHLVDHRRLMWASDHPHSDTTFPDRRRCSPTHTAISQPTCATTSCGATARPCTGWRRISANAVQGWWGASVPRAACPAAHDLTERSDSGRAGRFRLVFERS